VREPCRELRIILEDHLPVRELLTQIVKDLPGIKPGGRPLAIEPGQLGPELSPAALPLLDRGEERRQLASASNCGSETAYRGVDLAQFGPEEPFSLGITKNDPAVPSRGP
jgi:hypothetical protein